MESILNENAASASSIEQQQLQPPGQLNNNEGNANSNNDVELLSFMRTIHFLIDLETNEQNTEVNEQMFEFMSCVVKVIFKVAYCYKSTKDVCHKEGNSLLFAICSSYPSLIGVYIE